MTVYSLPVGALGTNCYIVSDQNGVAAVIDPGDDAARILQMLTKHGLTLGAVLLTHAHFDHRGAVTDLTDRLAVPVYCHRSEQAALTDAMLNLSGMFGNAVPPITDAVLVEDGDTITVGALSFTVMHTPGHTVGSCCYLAEHAVFAGDTLFFESIGRTDFPGGNMWDMQASLARLLTLDGETAVYPGHGEATTVSYEQRHNPYIFNP